LVIAGLYVDSLDGESAARTLQDVLAVDPQNERALEMLRELGYEVVGEDGEIYEEEISEEQFGQTYDEAGGDYGQQGPLPAYDLDDPGADAEVEVRYSDHPAALTEEEEQAQEGPLPAFPLEAPSESDAQFELVRGRNDPETTDAGQRPDAGAS